MKAKIIIVSVVSIAVFLLCINLPDGSQALYAADKVGYINVQRIVSESNLGKKAKAKIDKIREKRNKEIREKNTEIEALSNKLRAESQKKNINQPKIRELIEEIQQKNKELKRFVADVKEELAKKDRELVVEILKKADPILRKIAKKKGYSLILRNPDVLAYMDPDVDVTEEVIKRLNKAR